jgi:hypothetical protein
MFHVDPQNNTSIDTNTTPPDTVGLADDVIVSLEGNVGIGVFPEAGSPPLILTSGGTPSVPKSPLRIEDGKQQEGRVLTSNDASGNASWQDLPAGFTQGQVYGLHGIPAGFHQNVLPPTINVFTFTADTPGSYIFEVRWRGKFRNPVQRNFVHFFLYKGSTAVDQFEQYSGANYTDPCVFTVCFSFYSLAAKGDVFTLRTRPLDTPNGSGMDTQVSPAYTQAKVNVLRVDN